MNIVILSRNPRLYSTKRLVEEGLIRGHEVEVIDPLKCDIIIESEKPTIYYKDRYLDYVDAVIPRIGASITFFGCAVVRQFETGLEGRNAGPPHPIGGPPAEAGCRPKRRIGFAQETAGAGGSCQGTGTGGRPQARCRAGKHPQAGCRDSHGSGAVESCGEREAHHGFAGPDLGAEAKGRARLHAAPGRGVGARP